MKKASIKDFLTDREIRRAIELQQARSICEEIIKPNIARINKDLGQENDSMYLAYAVEYAVTQFRKQR